ncbi:MAG: InlB B-repeat-containing protein [bacterium]
MKKKAFLLFGFMSLMMVSWAAQVTTIEYILAHYQSIEHEEVIFEGFIEKYVVGTASTSSYYEIKGEYGENLRVNTSQPSPEINQRYRVTGTVTVHNGGPLIIEKSKNRVYGIALNVSVNPNEAGTASPSGRISAEEGESISLSASAARNYKFENWTQNNRVISTEQSFVFQMPKTSTVVVANFKRDWTMYIIGGIVLALILIAVIIIIVLNRSRSSESRINSEATPAPGSESATQPPKASDAIAGETVRINIDKDYSTVKLQQQAPATVKFIPGELEILNGLDKGKSIKMAGYPTADGDVATIGRDHEGWQNLVPAEKQYAHIRLKDESNTLSRMQAELVHRGGKLYLKNLSKVNPAQVDGEDVPVNEVVEVKPDSVIKAGFIEFRYKV